MFDETPIYEQKERSWVSLPLAAIGLLFIAFSIYAPSQSGWGALPLIIAAAVLLMVSYLVSNMYILGYSDRLVVRFGRFGPLHLTVKYSDIISVETVRLPLHMRWQLGLKRIGGGWLFNPGARDAVKVEYRPGVALIIGTSDPHRLKEFIEMKAASSVSFSIQG